MFPKILSLFPKLLSMLLRKMTYFSNIESIFDPEFAMFSIANQDSEVTLTAALLSAFTRFSDQLTLQFRRLEAFSTLAIGLA